VARANAKNDASPLRNAAAKAKSDHRNQEAQGSDAGMRTATGGERHRPLQWTVISVTAAGILARSPFSWIALGKVNENDFPTAPASNSLSA